MFKENLNKQNVIILDELLSVCIKEDIVTMHNLPNLNHKFIGDIPEFKYSEYRSYLEIIQESGKAKVDLTKDNFILKPINGITREFLTSGGYTAIIKDLQKENEHQELLRGKDMDDAEISRFNRERLDKYESRSKLSVWVAVGSIILSALAIGISIYSMFKVVP